LPVVAVNSRIRIRGLHDEGCGETGEDENTRRDVGEQDGRTSTRGYPGFEVLSAVAVCCE
jgi:hypothetical protein